MDNIIFTFLIEQSRIIEAIIAELKKHYNLTGGKNL